LSRWRKLALFLWDGPVPMANLAVGSSHLWEKELPEASHRHKVLR
jgi:hypothetical protein